MTRPKKQLAEALATLSWYGYELRDGTGHPLYRDRKGKLWMIFDRRTQKLVATYATLAQILAWADRNGFNRKANDL